MDDLIAKVNNLAAAVNRIEAMMLEDRVEKAKSVVRAQAMAKKHNNNRLTLLKTHRDKKRKELEELEGDSDEDYKEEVRDAIKGYNVQIDELKSKN